jgi:putative ABC transport system permease protein
MMFDLEAEIWNWIRNLRGNPGFEDGDIEEIELHIRDSIENSIYEGSSPEEAFKMATESFGQPELTGNEFIRSRTADLKNPKPDKLAHNYSSPENPISAYWILFSNHLKMVFRTIRQNKVLSFINILGMAIGLAASGIILSFVHQEYHFDSHLKNAEKTFRVIEKDGDSYDEYGYAPMAEYLREELPEIDDALRLAFYYGFLACRSGENNFNERSAIFSDPHFFNFFSFPLMEGNPDNCLTDRHSVVLSESAAQKYFGSSNPLGKPLEISEGIMFTVSAVFKDFPVNSNFRGDMILPLDCISELTQIWIEPSWDYHSDINTFVHLADGTSRKELTKKTQQFFSRHRNSKQTTLIFQPLSDIHTNSQFLWESRPQISLRILRILSLVAFLILGVSTINFLFLYIGIAAQRTKSIGIRKVIGASGKVLFREFFKEVSVLMLCSLLAAIPMVFFYLQVLVPAFSLPDLVYADTSLLLSLLGVLVLADLLAGLYPSYLLSSKKALTLIQQRSEVSLVSFRALPVLSILQFTLLFSLLSFNLLMQKQSRFLINQDTGYARDELFTIPMNMPVGQGIHGERFVVFAKELQKLPVLKQVTASFSSPASAECYTEGVTWDGQQDSRKQKVVWSWESVSYDYFRTLGVEMVQGRSFDPGFRGDAVNWETRECAFVINESGLREMGLEDPLGKTFSIWGFTGPIIGVVKDYHSLSMHSEMRPMFYFCNPLFWNEVVLRLHVDQDISVDEIQKVWKQFNDDYPFEMNAVDKQIRDLYTREQGLAKSLTHFSLLTVLVIGIGLITLSLLSFNRRIKEIGIRKVHGATSFEILRMLNKQYARFVLISCLLALAPTWFFMHKWLAKYAYKTSINWWIFFVAGMVTLLIALVTTSWKSWQAASKNPVESLRSE